MSWVGLREPKGGVYRTAGFGRRSSAAVDLGGILARGSLLMECTVVPGFGRQVLLRQAASYPWKSGLEFTLDDNGTLQVIQWQEDVIRVFRMPTTVLQRQDDVKILYTWDAPRRSARLTLEVPDRGLCVTREFRAPLPLSLRDAVRLCADERTAKLDADVHYLALADHRLPHGPLPCLDGRTVIPTPMGPVPVDRLKAGQLVTTADGSTAQVRWVGFVDVPAAGRHVARRVRAPWYGARRDLVAAHDQRLRLRGTEVEYLFAEEQVSVNIGDLTYGTAAKPPNAARVNRFWSLLLDRPAPVFAGGIAIETFDPAPLYADVGLRAHSVLRDLPFELLPQHGFDAPVLRAIETLTLCRLRAA